MIRVTLCTLTIIMASVALYQGYVASWHSAWLLALTFVTGMFTGLLLALLALWPDEEPAP